LPADPFGILRRLKISGDQGGRLEPAEAAPERRFEPDRADLKMLSLPK